MWSHCFRGWGQVCVSMSTTDPQIDTQACGFYSASVDWNLPTVKTRHLLSVTGNCVCVVLPTRVGGAPLPSRRREVWLGDWLGPVETLGCVVSRGFRWTCRFGLSLLLLLDCHERSLFQVVAESLVEGPWNTPGANL